MACSGADKGGSSGDDTSTTGAAGTAEPLDITAEVSEMVHTVVIVRWTTDEDSTGYVEFGETDGYGMVTPATESGTEHEVLLLGLWADTEFHFRVTAVDAAGGESRSGDLTITTLSLPSGVPTLTTTGEPGWDGFIAAPLQGTQYGSYIIDNQGHIVWYKVIDEPTHHLMRAQLSPDGAWVDICMAGQDSMGNKDEGYILKVSLDGYEEMEIPAPGIDHDMTVAADGTVTGIIVNPLEGYKGLADAITEIAEDGTKTEIWNAWDAKELLAPPEAYERDGNWTHANALDYYAADDDYMMAMKELHSMARVDRATGQLEWIFGGYGNMFEWAEGTEPVSMHHQFQLIDDEHLLVFENGEPDRGYSMVREFELDQANLIATEIWSYIRDPAVYVFSKGDVERLANGNTLVVWSSSGEIQEVTPDGDVVWQLNSDLGNGIVFIARTESMYGW